ncbi:Hypothetical protein FKW44_015636 [Caligus rogercresseyi]|uniref:Uncharacterized protein n=1 Tax=Caligus rogercresseyi TaxID=217165 RepID=A0A7T8H0N7_CALRO|nr:Hypothetical protein FKW44_015636 [Caligus rogercresseyi]
MVDLYGLFTKSSFPSELLQLNPQSLAGTIRRPSRKLSVITSLLPVLPKHDVSPEKLRVAKG